MPYISKEQRAQGGWVENAGDATLNTRHPGPCGHYEGGDLCGALSERRYLNGHRCEHHTPAKMAGRPEPVPPKPATPSPPPSVADRYGPVGTTDSPRFRADGVTPWPRETKGDN